MSVLRTNALLERVQAWVEGEGQPPRRWRSHSSRMQAASTALQKRADARAADIAPTIAELQAAGVTSLRAIAAALNEKRIPTARGNGEWTATRVMRVLERIEG